MYHAEPTLDSKLIFRFREALLYAVVASYNNHSRANDPARLFNLSSEWIPVSPSFKEVYQNGLTRAELIHQDDRLAMIAVPPLVKCLHVDTFVREVIPDEPGLAYARWTIYPKMVQCAI